MYLPRSRASRIRVAAAVSSTCAIAGDKLLSLWIDPAATPGRACAFDEGGDKRFAGVELFAKQMGEVLVQEAIESGTSSGAGLLSALGDVSCISRFCPRDFRAFSSSRFFLFSL